MTAAELIERLERAEGPSRELDWEIHLRNGLQGVGMYGDHPHYTASIDAALTLVPEGWSWSVGDLRGYSPPLWRCHVRDHRPQSLTPEGHSHIWREGNTNAGPALALCIAALKAKEADNG